MSALRYHPYYPSLLRIVRICCSSPHISILTINLSSPAAHRFIPTTSIRATSSLQYHNTNQCIPFINNYQPQLFSARSPLDAAEKQGRAKLKHSAFTRPPHTNLFPQHLKGRDREIIQHIRPRQISSHGPRSGKTGS